jgi:hypothetical protein
MISNQKNTLKTSEMTPESFVVSFEKNLGLETDFAAVEMLMKKLQFLGSNFDPFGAETSTECKAIMDTLHLTTHLQNPYLATNILLRLLDKTEERLNSLKQ